MNSLKEKITTQAIINWIESERTAPGEGIEATNDSLFKALTTAFDSQIGQDFESHMIMYIKLSLVMSGGEFGHIIRWGIHQGILAALHVLETTQLEKLIGV